MVDFQPQRELSNFLTPEQLQQLRQLENLIKKITDLKNNQPDKLSNFLNNLFKREERILPDGRKVAGSSLYDQFMSILKEDGPSFQPVQDWRKQQPESSIPPSSPIPLKENHKK